MYPEYHPGFDCLKGIGRIPHDLHFLGDPERELQPAGLCRIKMSLTLERAEFQSIEKSVAMASENRYKADCCHNYLEGVDIGSLNLDDWKAAFVFSIRN